MRKYIPYLPKIAKEEQNWRTDKPIMIEIGAGVGLHAINFSSKNQCDYIAIEKTKIKFQKFQNRVNHHQNLENLTPIYGDAIDWISQNIYPNEVEQYFILFPNPYPKKSQSNKRFINMPFMSFLIETLKINGTITIATNEKFYYEEVKEKISLYPNLEIIEDRLNYEYRTHFEKKYLERNEDCFNLILKKSF